MARLTKEDFFKRQLNSLRHMKEKNEFVTGKDVYEEIDNRISYINQNLSKKPIKGRKEKWREESLDNIRAYEEIKKVFEEEDGLA